MFWRGGWCVRLCGFAVFFSRLGFADVVKLVRLCYFFLAVCCPLPLILCSLLQVQWPKKWSVWTMANVSVASKASYLQASQWVAQVLQHYTLGDRALVGFFRTAENMKLDKDDVLASGAAVILNNREIWAGQAECLQLRRAQLLKKWQALPSASVRPRHPMGGLAAKDFKNKVHEMATWLASVDDCQQLAIWHHQAALQLVGRGFHYPAHLDGLQSKDVARFSADEKVKCLLQSALLAACHAAQRKRQRLASQVEALDRPAAVSAETAADSVKNCRAEAMDSAMVAVGQLRGPQAAMRHWSTAEVCDVLPALQQRAEALKLCSQQGSGPSVASGLKAWRRFAVLFLGYNADETLPPQSPLDVLKFIALFSSAGTAKNYVGYVAWACKFHGLPLTWRTPEIGVALQGLRKVEQERADQILKEVRLITPDIMTQLLQLCDNLPGYAGDGDLFLLAWQFLLRVQSEAVPLQYGEVCPQTPLPADRHSAVWVDSEFVCHLRLRRRKHMPAGSVMSRPCICEGSEKSVFCLSHRLGPGLSKLQQGQSLFPFTASQCLKRLRSLLSLLNVPGASCFTFKAFRAGKATALAKSGCPVHIIMNMGQWKSAAMLRYVSPDAFDEGVFWREVAQEEEDE